MSYRREYGLSRRFIPRNDMQKLVRCQRLQERPARANPQPVMYSPKVLLIVLCYCGDADCRTSSPQSPPCRRPKVRHAQLRPKARAGQRSLGSPFPTKRAALRGPVVMPAEGQRGSNAPLVLLSPQRGTLCGAPMHWFAMTYRRQIRVSGCKGASGIDTVVRGNGAVSALVR